MLFITLPELEDAINFWRNKSPSVGESLVLSKEASALAKPYAILIMQGAQRISIDNLDAKELDAWNKYLIETSITKG
jgi:hypothetical protein